MKNDIIFKRWLDKYKYHDRHPDNSKEYYKMEQIFLEIIGKESEEKDSRVSKLSKKRYLV